MKYRFLLLLFVAISTFLHAQMAPSDPLPLAPEIQTGKLDNGLTYYIRKNAKPEKKVELRLVVNAGSILETEKQQGLAHFCEHMAFNGTKNFPKNDLVSFLQSMGVRFGADLNAYTSFDETVYMLPIPLDQPGNLEKGFQVLEDWAHNCTYDPAEIDKERGVVLEEARLGKGADDRMLKKYIGPLFAGSRYAQRIPIGKEEILKNASYKTFKSFYKNWYRPNLMAVIVVGDIDPAAALALVKKHFGPIQNPKGAPKRVYAPVPPRAVTEAMVVTDPEATSYVLNINYDAQKASPETTLGDYQRSILRGLFTDMLNARLNDLRQSAKPPFLFGSAGYGGLVRGYELFNAVAAIGNEGVEPAINALVGAVEQARKFGFTQAELDRAKQRRMASMERLAKEKDKSESEGYAGELVRVFLQGEPAPGIENEFKYHQNYVPQITLKEVNELVNTFNLNAHKFIYLTGPEKGNIQLPSNAGLLAMFNRALQQDLKPYQEAAVASALMEPLTSGGAIVRETRDEVLGTTELTLSNGIEVTLKTTDFKNDEIQFTGIHKGGANNYGPEDRFNTALALSVMREMGVAGFSPSDLRKVTAGKTANVGPAIGGITSGFRGNSSVKDFETMLQLTYLYATAPRKDEALFQSFKARTTAQWAMMGANPQFAFVDTLYKFMYGNHPNAPLLPKPEVVEKVDLDRVVQIYKDRLTNLAGMHFTFVGSLNEETMKPLIAKYLGALPAAGPQPEWKDNGLRIVGGDREMKFYKGTEPQSLIQMVWFEETPYNPDMELKIDALVEILNIRVIEKLREELGGIYGGGFSGTMRKYPYESFQITLELPCGPENVQKLVDATQTEIQSLMTTGPKPEDLDKVKQQWREVYKENMKQNAYWLTNLEQIRFYGEDPKLFLEHEKRFDALTVKDVQDAAKLAFSGPNKLKAVLYPEEKK